MGAEIEAAWAQRQEAWARRRLLVVRLIAQHELTVAQITRVAEVSRQSVFTYRDTLLAGGVAALLTRKRAPGWSESPRCAARWPRSLSSDWRRESFGRPAMRKRGSKSGRTAS